VPTLIRTLNEPDNMPKYCPENERVKRTYTFYLQAASGKQDATVDAALRAIVRFEESTGRKPFSKFTVEQARSFRSRLEDELEPNGKALSSATITTTLKHLRSFFLWLSREPGFRSKLNPNDANYFTPSEQDRRIAGARRDKPVPSLHDIKRVLAAMPSQTSIKKRNRAVVAFAILSGARDGALASLRLKHIDLAARTVFQDAREVKTKRRKTFTSCFFPVGPEPLAGRLHRIAHGGPAFRPGRPPFSYNAGGTERGSWIRGTWTEAGALEHNRTDPSDFPGRFRRSESAVRQSALVSENVGETRRTTVPIPGRMEGVEPKSGSRKRSHDFRRLRRGPVAPAIRNYADTGQSEGRRRRHGTGHWCARNLHCERKGSRLLVNLDSMRLPLVAMSRRDTLMDVATAIGDFDLLAPSAAFLSHRAGRSHRCVSVPQFQSGGAHKNSGRIPCLMSFMPALSSAPIARMFGWAPLVQHV